MPTVVVFTKNNARVVHNPENLERFRNHPYCVVDPDLSQVKGTPPHFWKLEGGQILPMSALEQVAVLDHHEKYGVCNTLDHIPEAEELPQLPARRWAFREWKAAAIMAATLILWAAILGSAAWHWLH